MASVTEDKTLTTLSDTPSSPASTPVAPSENRNRAAPEVDERENRARVREILNRHPSVGMAVGVVRNDSLTFFYGHGLADIESKAPITEDTVFRIASITKTFTAIAVMQLWEQGLIDLDAPANDYLRAYKLIPTKAGFRPATVRHLLTHTSGIGEVLHPTDVLKPLFGETVKEGRPVPSLAEYYRRGIRIEAEPGARCIYTDHGFATIGQIVEDVSGEPLDRYVREHIFEPLGMASTSLIRSERVRSHLATGYTLRSNGARSVTDYEVVTVGGGAAYSTPRDMARYLAALLGGGANQHGSVLRPATLATIFEPHYQPDPRVPGIGLAFDRANIGGHRAVGHGGILPGFNSQIWVAPDDGVGVMAFTNGARNAMFWLPAESAWLIGCLLGVRDEVIRTSVPQRPELWGELCGWYQLSARLTDARVRAMIGAGAEVFVRRGQLMLRGLSPVPALFRGFPLHPDDDQDPYVFRIDLCPPRRPCLCNRTATPSHAYHKGCSGTEGTLPLTNTTNRVGHEKAARRNAPTNDARANPASRHVDLQAFGFVSGEHLTLHERNRAHLRHWPERREVFRMKGVGGHAA